MQVNSSTELADIVGRNLSTNGKNEDVGARIGNKLSKAEDKLLNLYTAPEFESADKEKAWLKENGFGKFSTIEGARNALQIRYQRAQRAFQAFTQLMQSMHELLMSAIRSLRVG